MTSKLWPIPALVVATALLSLPGFSAEPAVPAEDILPVPENMVVTNVPPLPEAAVEDLLPYENIRGASFQDWHPTERKILITTRFGEVSQLHRVAMPMGARTQLTFYDERVFGGQYRPGASGELIFSYDEGGAENYQLYLLDLATGKAKRFTDGEHRYTGTLWSNGGKLLAYVSNARNGRDFDLYVIDPRRPESERRVVELAGFWFPLDWSGDDQRLLLGEYVSANESYLHLVDLASGELTALTPAPAGGEKVSYRGGKWSRDGKSIYTASDLGSEFLRLVKIDLDSGERRVLSGGIDWNVEGFDLSDDGKLLVFVTNEDGIDRVHLLDTESGRELPAPQLPPGTLAGGAFRPGGHEIAFTLSWARSPSDVYTYDPDSGQLHRWTESEVGGLNPESFSVPELVRYPTFDEVTPGERRTIPAFVYRPDRQRFPGPRPVYIDIHGGPEGQARPDFLGSMNYLLEELGVAVIFPNVRGSDGYGKSYLTLDNAEKREDSVKDIGALLDWIATQPDLDASRVMVGGGSYGGYMSLAVMTHYSDRLRAGFDYVGISNFVTFLENTQDYRRDLRRVEYGDEREPEMRKILEAISPSNHAAKIRKPLLVAQGANDPRVPLSESDQIVAELAENDIPVWYIVAKDEGHGFSKKSNADYLRATWVEFIERFLLAPPKVAEPEPVEAGG